MSESISEIVMATLKTRLETIVADAGVTAWYTPSKVARVPALQDMLKDDSLTTLYLMVPDRSTQARANTCRIGVDLQFDLVLCTRFLGNGNVWDDGASRGLIQKRLAEDATDVLVSNATLNALITAGADVSEVVVLDDVGSPEETWIDGWVVAFLGVTVRYRYLAGAFGVAS